MQNKSLAARMKAYETHYHQTLLPNAPYIVRLDGRKFETYAKALNLHQPYDALLRNAILYVAKEMGERTKASFVYTISDEITLGFSSSDDAMFNGRTDKINSTFASLASVLFNNKMNEYFMNRLNGSVLLSELEHENLQQQLKISKSILPTFDCRVFSLPNKYEALNNLLWREQDIAKQDLFRYAKNHFKFNEIKGLTFEKLKTKLLEEHNIDWANTEFETHRSNGVLYLEGIEDIDVQQCITAWHLFETGVQQMKLNHIEERNYLMNWVNLFRIQNPFTFSNEVQIKPIKESHEFQKTDAYIKNSWFNRQIINAFMKSQGIMIGYYDYFYKYDKEFRQNFENDYNNLFKRNHTYGNTNTDPVSQKLIELNKSYQALPLPEQTLFVYTEAQQKCIDEFRKKYHDVDLMGRLIEHLRQTPLGKQSDMLYSTNRVEELCNNLSDLYDKPHQAPIYELLDWHYYLWQYCIFLSDIPFEKLTIMTKMRRRCLYELDVESCLFFRKASLSNTSSIQPLLEYLDYHDLDKLFFTFDKSHSKQKFDVQFDE